MSHYTVRVSFGLLIAAFLNAAVLAAQDNSANSADPSSTGQKSNKKKPKNSDVDNIGTRDINKGGVDV